MDRIRRNRKPRVSSTLLITLSPPVRAWTILAADHKRISTETGTRLNDFV